MNRTSCSYFYSLSQTPITMIRQSGHPTHVRVPVSWAAAWAVIRESYDYPRRLLGAAIQKVTPTPLRNAQGMAGGLDSCNPPQFDS